MNLDLMQMLQALTACPAPSGCEEQIHALCRGYMTALHGDVRTDALHNLLCTFGQGPHHIVLEAHLDEISMVVTDVCDGGFLKVAPCGGLDERMLPGSEVLVLGCEQLAGVVTTLPPHLKKQEKTPQIDELAVDVCCDAAHLPALVQRGDRVVFKRHFTKLLGDRVSANCLDDRSGAAAVLLAAQMIHDADLPVKITVVLAAQEEVGNRGAATALYRENADEAICVDVSFAYSPGCKAESCGKLGQGAMIGISPVLDRAAFETMVALAKENQIPHQVEVMNGRTSTDADAFTVSGSGVPCALLSIPQRYMHTPVEVVQRSDIQAVADLIFAYVRKKAGEADA